MAFINSSTSQLIPLKVTVLGHSGTGKSSFLASLSKDSAS